jgi:hypothetical protein
MKPVTPTLSVAVKAVMETVKDVEDAGTPKEVTVGGVASAAGAGTLAGFPGKVLAWISVMLLYPSPSESNGSMAAKL